MKCWKSRSFIVFLTDFKNKIYGELLATLKGLNCLIQTSASKWHLYYLIFSPNKHLVKIIIEIEKRNKFQPSHLILIFSSQAKEMKTREGEIIVFRFSFLMDSCLTSQVKGQEGRAVCRWFKRCSEWCYIMVYCDDYLGWFNYRIVQRLFLSTQAYWK